MQDTQQHSNNNSSSSTHSAACGSSRGLVSRVSSALRANAVPWLARSPRVHGCVSQVVIATQHCAGPNALCASKDAEPRARARCDRAHYGRARRRADASCRSIRPPSFESVVASWGRRATTRSSVAALSLARKQMPELVCSCGTHIALRSPRGRAVDAIYKFIHLRLHSGSAGKRLPHKNTRIEAPAFARARQTALPPRNDRRRRHADAVT